MKPETATENSPEPRPAATLVLLRRTARCPLQALMVVRHTAVEFAGGAAVFPGGRVDASDHVGTEADDDAFRFAAIRDPAKVQPGRRPRSEVLRQPVTA